MKTSSRLTLAVVVAAAVMFFATANFAKNDAVKNGQKMVAQNATADATNQAVAKADNYNAATPAQTISQMSEAKFAPDISSHPAKLAGVTKVAQAVFDKNMTGDATNAYTAMADAGAAVIAAQTTSGEGDYDVILPTVNVAGGFHAYAGLNMTMAQNAAVAT